MITTLAASLTGDRARIAPVVWEIRGATAFPRLERERTTVEWCYDAE
jgi:hypothetical protein